VLSYKGGLEISLAQFQTEIRPSRESSILFQVQEFALISNHF
jgi:hypothetical protein